MADTYCVKKRIAVITIKQSLSFVISITFFLRSQRKKREMNNIVPIRDNSTADIADALDAETDSMWGLIAVLQTIFTEHDGDPYIRGALHLANRHLDALAAIRRDVDRL